MSICKHCQEGHVPLGEHFVTHDMALDAGEPSMEGQSVGIEWGQCPCCGSYEWEHCTKCTEEENVELRAVLGEMREVLNHVLVIYDNVGEAVAERMVKRQARAILEKYPGGEQ